MNNPTLTIDGRTPYAQIPKWVIRSGNKLSHVAVRLYGAIMCYADNETLSAFPAREALANDLGVSVATVKRAIKELETFGALKVERRRNKKTGNFYANHYTLAFSEPWVIHDPRPGVTNDPITKPTNLTTPTNGFTSDLRSDEMLHAQAKPAPTRKTLVAMLTHIGELRAQGHDFWDDETQVVWETFLHTFEGWVGREDFDTMYAHLLHNQWTISKACADPYKAGAELNKILATGQTL